MASLGFFLAVMVSASPANTEPLQCDAAISAHPLPVSADSIGPFPVSAPLAVLRQLCPGARTTIGAGFETAWAALDLSVEGLTVLAAQNWRMRMLQDPPDTGDLGVDWERPSSHWTLRGCGAILPKGVSSCATWAELVGAFGQTGAATAEFGPVVVTLDNLPGFSFQLDATDETVGSIENHHDLSRIPGTARVVEVVVSGVEAGAG